MSDIIKRIRRILAGAEERELDGTETRAFEDAAEIIERQRELLSKCHRILDDFTCNARGQDMDEVDDTFLELDKYLGKATPMSSTGDQIEGYSTGGNITRDLRKQVKDQATTIEHLEHTVEGLEGELQDAIDVTCIIGLQGTKIAEQKETIRILRRELKGNDQ